MRRFPLLVIALTAVAGLVGACGPAPAEPAGPGTSAGGPGTGGAAVREPDVISGRVLTTAGAPVAGARLRIVGYTGGDNLGQYIETVLTGPDGTYRHPVPNGLYEVLGEGDLAFDGQTYVFSLDPVDGSCDQELSDAGIVKDFVLRLTGLQMCFDGVDPENYLFYHGATVQLRGTLETAGADDLVEYSFAALGPFADGAPAQVLTFRRTVAAHSTSFGPLEGTWVLHDIPLARYAVSASLVTADGRRLPLLLSTDAAPTPTETVELAFEPRVIVGEPAVGYRIPSLTVEVAG